ncbi:hypothetical protein [Amycolatopsis sp. NPDC003861]
MAAEDTTAVGGWQFALGERSVRLRRPADDLGAYPGVGFSCPEEALQDLITLLTRVEESDRYRAASGRPSGPCAITLHAGQARLHIPALAHGTREDEGWQPARMVDLRYGDVPTLLRKVSSLVDGTYGRGPGSSDTSGR